MDKTEVKNETTNPQPPPERKDKLALPEGRLDAPQTLRPGTQEEDEEPWLVTSDGRAVFM